jgi:hypothetical protein
MQALAAEFSGWSRKFRCSLEQKSLKTVCFGLYILQQALKWTRRVCLRAF